MLAESQLCVAQRIIKAVVMLEWRCHPEHVQQDLMQDALVRLWRWCCGDVTYSRCRRAVIRSALEYGLIRSSSQRKLNRRTSYHVSIEQLREAEARGYYPFRLEAPPDFNERTAYLQELASLPQASGFFRLMVTMSVRGESIADIERAAGFEWRAITRRVKQEVTRLETPPQRMDAVSDSTVSVRNNVTVPSSGITKLVVSNRPLHVPVAGRADIPDSRKFIQLSFQF